MKKTRTIEDVKKGDVIVSQVGYQMLAIERLGELVFLSYGWDRNNTPKFIGEQKEMPSYYSTIQQLKKEGFTLLTDPPAPKSVKLKKWGKSFNLPIEEVEAALKAAKEGK